MRDYSIGGTQVAFEAQESMRSSSRRSSARGVRVVTMRTGGVPASLGDAEGYEEIVEGMHAATMPGRAATLEDVGNVAAFIASDQARTMTAATVNVRGGRAVD